MTRILIALVVLAGLAHAETEPEQDPPEPAFVLALEWSGGGVSIKAKDRKEAVVPAQNGMPALRPFFFVLMDGEKNVHYSGGLVDPRALHTHGKAEGTATSRLIVPALDDARHFVIYERRSMDLQSGRHVVLETDL